MANINDTIMNWAHSSLLFQKACFSDSELFSCLNQAFGDNEEKRFTASIFLYEKIWSKYPEFGPCPMIQLLAEFEYDRVFYKRYRDHSSHVIKTYIIGLFLYDKNTIIKNSFISYHFADGTQMNDDLFIKTWTVTALCHDIGYLFENEEIDKHKDYWTLLVQQINPRYMYPLSHIMLLKDNLPQSEEKRYMQLNSIPCYSIDTISSIENNDDLFQFLLPFGVKSGLVSSKTENPLKCFYMYARGHKSNENRPCYADHGIIGALLLLKMWFGFKDHVNSFNKYDLNFFQNVIKTKIISLQVETDKIKTCIIEAAGAIALHNINKGVWIQEELFDCGVNINRFKILLNDMCEPDYFAQPFAFLLRLSDELQMWDRTLFSMPVMDEHTLHGCDMDISIQNEKIMMWFKSDEDYTNPRNPNSRFSKLMSKLAICMNIDVLLDTWRIDGQVSKVTTTQYDLEEAKQRYFKYLELECGEIRLDGLPSDDQVGSKVLRLEKLFIPLKFRERTQREGEIVLPQDGSDLPGKDFIDHIIPEDVEPFCRVLLAGPGSGKTTLLKRIAIAYSYPNRFSEVSDGLPCREFFPLWIKCRKLNQYTIFSFNDIIERIPQEAEFRPTESNLSQALQQLCYSHIEKGTALLLIDGLDEITNIKVRNSFVEQLAIFIKSNPSVNLLLTSRIAGFRMISQGMFSSFKQFEIVPFSANDIIKLCVEWHKVVLDERQETMDQAKELASSIISSPQIFSLAKSPLLLTALLLVNRRVGRLPTRRAALYKESIRVLLETWNQAGHEPLELEVAKCLLAYVAFDMAKRGVQTIVKKDLLRLLAAARQEQDWIIACDNEPLNKFIERVELRSSLLVKRGYSQVDEKMEIDDEYEFQHLTFQEYLTSVAVVEGYYAGADQNDEFTDILSDFIQDENNHEIILLASVLAKKKANRIVDLIINQIDSIDTLTCEKLLTALKNLLLNIVVDEAMLSQETRGKIYQLIFGRGISSGQIDTFRRIMCSRYADEFNSCFKQDNNILWTALNLYDSKQNSIDFVIKKIENSLKEADCLDYNLRIFEHVLWLWNPNSWYRQHNIYFDVSAICDLLVSLIFGINDNIAQLSVRSLNELLCMTIVDSYSPRLSFELVQQVLLLMYRNNCISGVEICSKAFVNRGTYEAYQHIYVNDTIKEFYYEKYTNSTSLSEKCGLFWACVYSKKWNNEQIMNEISYLYQRGIITYDKKAEIEEKINKLKMNLASISSEELEEVQSEGVHYYVIGEKEKAFNKFLTSFELDQNDITVRNNLAYMLRRNEIDGVNLFGKSYSVTELLEPGIMKSESFSLVNMALYVILNQKIPDWSLADKYFSQIEKYDGFPIRMWWEYNVLYDGVEGDIVMLFLCRYGLTIALSKWDVDNWYNNIQKVYTDTPYWMKERVSNTGNEVMKRDIFIPFSKFNEDARVV